MSITPHKGLYVLVVLMLNPDTPFETYYDFGKGSTCFARAKFFRCLTTHSNALSNRLINPDLAFEIYYDFEKGFTCCVSKKSFGIKIFQYSSTKTLLRTLPEKLFHCLTTIPNARSGIKSKFFAEELNFQLLKYKFRSNYTKYYGPNCLTATFYESIIIWVKKYLGCLMQDRSLKCLLFQQYYQLHQLRAFQN